MKYIEILNTASMKFQSNIGIWVAKPNWTGESNPANWRVQCAVLGAMRKHGDPKSRDFVSSRSRRSHSILYESENVERCRQIISTYIRGADTDWHWAMRCIACHSVGSFPEIPMSYTVTHRKSMKIHSFCEAKDMIFCGFETLLLTQKHITSCNKTWLS